MGSELAEKQGHTVAFTPPHYSDLQPIELIWWLIKGNIGRQHTTESTLAIVLQQLEAEFIKLYADRPPIQRMISKCVEKAAELHKQIVNNNLGEDEASTCKLNIDDKPMEEFDENNNSESGSDDSAMPWMPYSSMIRKRR